MTTRLKIWVVVLFLLTAGAVSLAIYFRNHGFSAREKPSWMETVMARHARRIATPAGAKELQIPFPQTEAGMAEAREHFVEHCSVCHGIDGRGETTIGRNLYPKVPSMADANTQQLTDGELFYIISNGIRFTGMPAWGDEDSPESIWALVAFIRHLPQLSPEELKKMQESASGSKGHEKAEPETVQPKKMSQGDKVKTKSRSHDQVTKPHNH